MMISPNEDYLKIIERLTIRSGSQKAAEDWFKTYRIPPLGYCTPKELFDSNEIKELLLFIDHMEQGGYS